MDWLVAHQNNANIGGENTKIVHLFGIMPKKITAHAIVTAWTVKYKSGLVLQLNEIINSG